MASGDFRCETCGMQICNCPPKVPNQSTWYNSETEKHIKALQAENKRLKTMHEDAVLHANEFGIEAKKLEVENERLKAENERLEELLAVHAQISANRRRLQEAYKLGYADDVMDTSIKLEALDKQVLVLSEALKKGSE